MAALALLWTRLPPESGRIHEFVQKCGGSNVVHRLAVVGRPSSRRFFFSCSRRPFLEASSTPPSTSNEDLDLNCWNW
jgi:hypothetical protein